MRLRTVTKYRFWIRLQEGNAPPNPPIDHRSMEQEARRKAEELTQALSAEQRQAGWHYTVEKEVVSVRLTRHLAGSRGRGERRDSYGR